MPIINRAGWPLGANITCGICETQWTIEVGDLARIVVDPELRTIEADAPCPGCDTLWTSTRAIGKAKAPVWEMAELQPNHIEPGERITAAIALIEETVAGEAK